jgi:hypothetical protein
MLFRKKPPVSQPRSTKRPREPEAGTHHQPTSPPGTATPAAGDRASEHGLHCSNRPREAPPRLVQRTTFQIGTPSVSSSAEGTDVTGNEAKYTVLESYHPVLDLLLAELADPDRIQVPLLPVALVFDVNAQPRNKRSASAATETSFSFVSSMGTALFPRGVSPDQAAALLRNVVVHLSDRVFVLPRDVGLELMEQLRTRKLEVDVLTVGASLLYVSLFSHMFASRSMPRAAGAYWMDHVCDVRTMAWLLAGQDAFSEFDQLVAQYSPGLKSMPRPVQTLEGAADRVVHLRQIYRRLYGALGSNGLLPPFII